MITRNSVLGIVELNTFCSSKRLVCGQGLAVFVVANVYKDIQEITVAI
jgi:hypothetical protein